MMSTARANLSVGPPYDVGIYLNGSHRVMEYRFESDSPLLTRLREAWERHLLTGIAELQSFSHEDLGSEPTVF
jgi:putative proteasome-type protease